MNSCGDMLLSFVGSAFFAGGGEEFALLADAIVDGGGRRVGNDVAIAVGAFGEFGSDGGGCSGGGSGFFFAAIGFDGGEQRLASFGQGLLGGGLMGQIDSGVTDFAADEGDGLEVDAQSGEMDLGFAIRDAASGEHDEQLLHREIDMGRGVERVLGKPAHKQVGSGVRRRRRRVEGDAIEISFDHFFMGGAIGETGGANGAAALAVVAEMVLTTIESGNGGHGVSPFQEEIRSRKSESRNQRDTSEKKVGTMREKGLTAIAGR